MLLNFKNIVYPGILEPLYAAEGYGGVLLSLCKYLLIFESIFDQNTNKFAGVGYLSSSQDNQGEILIENNIFKNNRAGENSGVFWLSSNFRKLNCVIKNNLFMNNIAKSNFYIIIHNLTF